MGKAAGVLGAAGVSAAALLAAEPALAQAAASPTVVDELIVTATRREENIQTVPASITAVTGEQIERAGLRNTQELQQAAPSLVITVAASESTGAVIRIRGIGSQAPNPGVEPAVGVFVDGVYRNRSGIALNDLLDVERVEVLRGPQGTLFGKNTSAGAIAITTRRPAFVWGGEAAVGAGNFDSRLARFTATGPLVDGLLAFRLSASHNQRDGYIRDLRLGDLHDRDRQVVRGQLLFTPAETLSVRLIADYSKKDEACCTAPFVRNGPRAANVAALGGTVFNPTRERDYLTATNFAPYNTAEDQGLSLDAEWDLGFADWRTIVSTRNYIAGRAADSDFTDLDILTASDEKTVDRLDTFETTLTGEAGPLDWLVGAYLFDSRYRITGKNLVGADTGRFFQSISGGLPIAGLYAPGTGDRLRMFFQEGDGWSLFTHNTWRVTDRLKLTVGLRYLDEEKTGGGVFVVVPPAICATTRPASLKLLCPTANYQASYADSTTTWNLSAAYQASPTVMVFAAASHGFKAGGVSLDRDAGNRTTQVFLPEESDNYELGVKSVLFARRLILNLTLFETRFENFQRTVFTGTENILSNQGEVTSRGAELESLLRVSEALRLSGGVSYIDAQYGSDVTDAAIAGRRLNASPMWTVQAGAFFDRPVTDDLELSASLNARYISATVTGADLDPLKRQGGYTLVNARVGLTHLPSDLTVSVWANNLTDQFYRVVTFNSTGQAGSLNAFVGEPRTWGVELLKRF